ncbi:hypothetical protein HHI_13315 [Hyphomonas hirschiana VP5]|nr:MULTISPECIES: hypothetical protein [Hyphomonas]KCZ90520.1 hypothetical protein HHI_13315 [Hyphomonas hirschiana VP5]
MAWLSLPAFGRRVRSHWRALLTCIVFVSIAVFLMLTRPDALPESEALDVPVATSDNAPLRAANEFEAILDPSIRSVALFEEAGRVIRHPRCMNCHPRTDRPTQTDAMRPHLPWVAAGQDGGGGPTLRCASCHNADNFEPSGVPGNPGWRLAPLNMGWQGLTLGEICRQIQDPERGGMARDELLHHMREDSLVGWAWHPGGGRTPAPGSQDAFGSLIEAWIATGALCPE